jgi:hypothetical protein
MVGWPIQPADEIPELVMTVFVQLDTSHAAISHEECRERSSSAEGLADAAVWSLIEEASLTPKPALVDERGCGAHCDMNLEMLHRSAPFSAGDVRGHCRRGMAR